MSFLILRKALDEGTSSPLVARLYSGMLELCDDSLLRYDDAERARFKSDFDSKLTAIFEGCVATRDAAREIIRLVVSHKSDIVNEKIVSVTQGSLQIHEAIDMQLGQEVDKFLDQAVVASKSSLQIMLSKVFDIDIGFVNEKSAPFRAGVDRLQQSGMSDLATYLTAVRELWLSALQQLRNQHEHHGWHLPLCQYHLNKAGHVELVVPQILGQEVQDWARQTANRVLLHVEEMLVYALAQRMREPFFIAEIPTAARDPNFVKRFCAGARGVGSYPRWLLSYHEGNDFL